VGILPWLQCLVNPNCGALGEVIVLRNLEGLSHEQVATRMGRAVGAVRMFWLRALSPPR
jgi:hypothetical protein